jgi:hypothetical protein
MTEHDHSDLLNRAVRLLTETYVGEGQPWHRPHRELRLKEGFPPDTILVYAAEAVSGALEPEDVLLHAIAVCPDVSTLSLADEDEDASFPFLDNVSAMPGNCRWLVVPEDADLEEGALSGLEEACSSLGIGLVLCYSDEDYDEIHLDAEVIGGEFLTAYSGWKEMLGALSEQAKELADYEEPAEGEEEPDYQMSDWDSSGDYD